MLEVSLESNSRTQFLDITDKIQQSVANLDFENGLVVVFNPHTTAGVTINEGADPDVVRDISVTMDKMIPWQDGYHHAEGNSAAHIKASMFGSSVTIMVENGQLCLGTWQKVYFCEFDGPRRRKFWVRGAAGQ
jgi:secondary thiamine-phosphate synthase enzyme